MKHEGALAGREWNPRTARIDVGYDVLVRCAAGDIPAKVLNISRGGFRVRSGQPLEQGWEVTLELARMEPVKATVRWVSGLDAGGVFAEAAAL